MAHRTPTRRGPVASSDVPVRDAERLVMAAWRARWVPCRDHRRCSTSPQERPDGLCQFVRVVVVGGVRAGRARDLHTEAVGQSAGGLGVDGVAFLAHEHHDGHRDRGQRLVIGQEALVAPELDPEEGLGTELHARP